MKSRWGVKRKKTKRGTKKKMAFSFSTIVLHEREIEIHSLVWNKKETKEAIGTSLGGKGKCTGIGDYDNQI